MFLPVDEQLQHIRRGVEEIVPEDALIEKLKQAEKTGTPLRIKLGCDPSRPDLHLGHSVVLRKLRQFQDLGHKAILIIGDFTGMIGDPSGKSKTRPALTLEETRINGESYFEQATKILDPNPDVLEIHYNSKWLDEMSFSDVIKLAAQYTVAQMLERDDFRRRYTEQRPISIHEFLYPLAQAQDSVDIRADVELGGTDQKFNLLVGRTVQQANGMDPQVCIMLPLLEGTDGIQKMSKSLDNYIGITEPAPEIYGKALSIPDDLIYRYFELATDVPTESLPAIKAQIRTDPRNAKHHLAWTLAEMYHNTEAADAARAHFEKTVVRKEVPDDMPTFTPETATLGLLNLMRSAGLVNSNGEARRLVQQNAVSIDGKKVTDPNYEVNMANAAPFVLKVGKRKYVRVLPE